MRTVPVLGVLSVIAVAAADAQVAFGGSVGYLDRRLTVGSDVEHQAGMVGSIDVALNTDLLRLTLSGGGGKLSAKTAATPDADYGRLSGEVAVFPVPWLALSGGVSASAFVTSIGTQRWILPRLGAELRPAFVGIPAEPYLAGAIIVGATTNSPVEASGGMCARGGLLVGQGRLQFSVDYRLERLNFDAATGRQEQRGEIGAGLVVRF